MISSANEARSRQDYEQFLLNELVDANLKEDEQVLLEQELERLNNAETIKRSLLNAIALLTNEETAANTLIKEAGNQLGTIEKFSPEIMQLNERLRSSLIELKDIASELEMLETNTQHNAERLFEVQERLDKIYALQQKHRVATNGDLINIQQDLESSLLQLSSSDEEIEKLKKEIELSTQALFTQATQLSKSRANAIKVVEKNTAATLSNVNMPNAKLVLNQQALTDLTKDGLDNIALFFSANAGQAPAPVSKVASGGELSRLMLAIKSLLAKHTSLPTLIFDEIDTGISGETALKVGNVIADLGNDLQILSITHLPQIAAKGNSHYFVYKSEAGKKTTTGIKKLSKEERVDAIAEMLSGKNPGTSALQNAKELLG